MWWPFIPWLLFLAVLVTTFAVYQYRHHQQRGHGTVSAASKNPTMLKGTGDKDVAPDPHSRADLRGPRRIRLPRGVPRQRTRARSG